MLSSTALTERSLERSSRWKPVWSKSPQKPTEAGTCPARASADNQHVRAQSPGSEGSLRFARTMFPAPAELAACERRLRGTGESHRPRLALTMVPSPSPDWATVVDTNLLKAACKERGLLQSGVRRELFRGYLVWSSYHPCSSMHYQAEALQEIGITFWGRTGLLQSHGGQHSHHLLCRSCCGSHQ